MAEKIRHTVAAVIVSCFLVFSGYSIPAAELKSGIPKPEIFRVIFSGDEFLHYTISWSGGIKIGDLYLTVLGKGNDTFEIQARVTDYGVFRFFYPVDDTFVTYVQGSDKLPFRYEVLQKEGMGSVTNRLTQYDQAKKRVKYRKNKEQEIIIDIAGEVHNEFSSFFATRAMDLKTGNSFMVPTFADKKRNEVKVQIKEREKIKSLFGQVDTVQVMPIMKFKGLYDKDGDTVIWFTDDGCRVPVKINSKILIGSLTAELIEYRNSACSIYE